MLCRIEDKNIEQQIFEFWILLQMVPFDFQFSSLYMTAIWSIVAYI